MDCEEKLDCINDALYHIRKAVEYLNAAGEQDIARMLELVEGLAASAEERVEAEADDENARNEQAMLYEYERSVL